MYPRRYDGSGGWEFSISSSADPTNFGDMPEQPISIVNDLKRSREERLAREVFELKRSKALLASLLIFNQNNPECQFENVELVVQQVEAHLNDPSKVNLPPRFENFNSLPKVVNMSEEEIIDEMQRRCRSDLAITGRTGSEDLNILRERLRQLRDDSFGCPIPKVEERCSFHGASCDSGRPRKDIFGTIESNPPDHLRGSPVRSTTPEPPEQPSMPSSPQPSTSASRVRRSEPEAEETPKAKSRRVSYKPEANGLFLCTELNCNSKFENANGLAKHKKTVHEKNFPCESCSYRGSSSWHLKRHMQRAHK